MIGVTATITTLLQSALFGAFLSVVYITWSSTFLLFGVCINNEARVYVARKSRTEIFKKSVLFFCDILFFILITPISAIFLFGVNYGIVRWYIIIFALLGFFLFRKTIGQIIEKILVKIVLKMRKIFRKLVSVSLNYTIKKIKVKKRSSNFKERVVLFQTNSKTGLK